VVTGACPGRTVRRTNGSRLPTDERNLAMATKKKSQGTVARAAKKVKEVAKKVVKGTGKAAKKVKTAVTGKPKKRTTKSSGK
jgi:hypothetical protein